MTESKHTPDALTEALARFVNAPPCPVFTAALDALKKGAPGLSERSCEALARSIAIKVTHGAYGKSRTALLGAGKLMADDYQTSPGHHPDHVLVPAAAFDAMRDAIAQAEGRS